jgi:Pyridoxamine 5'-phosphate oxidase
VPTWYLYEDGRILVNGDVGRKRLDHLHRDPRVSLTVLDRADRGTHVSIQGRVTEFAEDTEFADIDRISMHYTGTPYAVAVGCESAPGSRSTGGMRGAAQGRGRLIPAACR